MNIGIDVSAAVHGRAGLGRYAHELVEALRRIAPAHALTLFYNVWPVISVTRPGALWWPQRT
jgi:hypothetical protein